MKIARLLQVALLCLAFAVPAASEPLLPFGTSVTGDQTFAWRNQSHTGVVLILNVSSAGTGTLTPRLEVESGFLGTWRELSDFTAVTTSGTYTYFIGPTVPGTPPAQVTETEALPLPLAEVRLVLDKSDASEWSIAATRYFLK